MGNSMISNLYGDLTTHGILTTQAGGGDPALSSPVRNRYFYGKLLDAYHLDLEQQYGKSMRWLMNRLSLGTGVLCGLAVAKSNDGSMVRVGAGVAVDGLGREIIVPEDSPGIDPRQPTDECGRPDGKVIQPNEVAVLYICYHECEAEPVPAIASRCEEQCGCENGLVRERYRLIVRRADAESLEERGNDCGPLFFRHATVAERRMELCVTRAEPCGTPAEVCVPLATIEIDATDAIGKIKPCAVRRPIYSNEALLELILCLAARVDKCCGDIIETTAKAIAIQKGDQQKGSTGTTLKNGLVVHVTDGGKDVDAEPVTFTVASGGGKIGENSASLATSYTTKTKPNGTATLPRWDLGSVIGQQTVIAKIATGAPTSVTFVATGEK